MKKPTFLEPVDPTPEEVQELFKTDNPIEVEIYGRLLAAIRKNKDIPTNHINAYRCILEYVKGKPGTYQVNPKDPLSQVGVIFGEIEGVELDVQPEDTQEGKGKNDD